MDFTGLFSKHPMELVAIVIGCYVLSAILNGMPPPKETDSRGYHWMYNSFQILGANLSNVTKRVQKPVEPKA